MGEAKRRAAARKDLNETMERVDLPRLASAMRRLATAASGQLGGDCYMHALIAQAILARLGVESTICVGWSGWRVGPGDSDVVLHKMISGMAPQPGVAYHTWLEIDNYILDFSTWSLRLKAAQLDALDGGTTVVTFCPDYLYVKKSSVSSLKDVTQLTAGLYYYEQDTDLQSMIKTAAIDLDDGDVEIAWKLYNNPDLAIYGPNNMPANSLIISST